MTVSQREKRAYRRSLNPTLQRAKTRRITVRMFESEYRHLEALARKKKAKISTLVRYFIREGMKNV